MNYRKINDYQIYVYPTKDYSSDLIAIIEISDKHYGGKSYDVRTIEGNSVFMRFDKLRDAKEYVRYIASIS